MEVFDCRALGVVGAEWTGGVLIADYSISCASAHHRTYQVFGLGVIIVVVIGAPATFVAALIWWTRPTGSTENLWVVHELETRLKISSRDAKNAVKSTEVGKKLSFMNVYKARLCFWEALDCLQKVVIVATMVFTGRGSTGQLTVSITLSVLAFAGQCHLQPCKMRADNWLRASVQFQIFFTSLMLLVRKIDHQNDAFGTEFYDSMLLVSFTINVPISFTISLYMKVVVVKKLHRSNSARIFERPEFSGLQADPHASAKIAFGMYQIGFSGQTSKGGLVQVVKQLRNEYNQKLEAEALSAADVRLINWAMDDLGLTSCGDRLQDIEACCRRLHVSTNLLYTRTDVLGQIRAAINEQVRKEEGGGVFLSHFQANGGPDMMDLKVELERKCPNLRDEQIWYDKDQVPSEDEMRLGVRSRRFFLLYLTQDVLLRPYCRKEIRWALLYDKTTILLWKQEGTGAVASFNCFLEDCQQLVDDDNGEGLREVLGAAAIPYYIDGSFHSASLSELLGKLGETPETSSSIRNLQMTTDEIYVFSPLAVAPPLTMACNPANGFLQGRTIANQLTAACPGLSKSWNTTPAGEIVMLSAEFDMTDTLFHKRSVVVVYVTEGLETAPVLSLITRMIMANTVKILWVAETDMRHGWKEAMAHHASWRDAVMAMCSAIPTDCAPTQAALLAALQADTESDASIIPYYKDGAFRRVSLSRILRAIEAEPLSAQSEARVRMAAATGQLEHVDSPLVHASPSRRLRDFRRTYAPGVTGS
jgi:hypothetical protein